MAGLYGLAGSGIGRCGKGKTDEAAVGFEPTNNGFANRRLDNCKSLSRNYLAQVPKPDLASCLAQIVQDHPELTTLIEAWPALSTDIRTAILRIAGK